MSSPFCHCFTRNEFAYSSSDKMVYIRKFSLDGHQMVSCNTLQGHDGEVTCICWNEVKSKWVTGSDDGTIRIWVSKFMLIYEKCVCSL